MSKHLCLQTTNWLSSLPRPKFWLDFLNHKKWLERPSFFSCIYLHKVLISSHINPWRLSPCKYFPRECPVFVGSLSIPPYFQTSPTPSISTPLHSFSQQFWSVSTFPTALITISVSLVTYGVWHLAIPQYTFVEYINFETCLMSTVGIDVAPMEDLLEGVCHHSPLWPSGPPLTT